MTLTHWHLGNLDEILGPFFFQIISVIDGWVISCEVALRWMSLDLADDKSTLVQVMAWCRQATSHYLSQCWPRSLVPYGVTKPQWVKSVKEWYKMQMQIYIFSKQFSMQRVNPLRPGDIYKLGHHWFRLWLVTHLVPCHYLKQCWLIPNWTFGNTFQRNFNQNTTIFIQENIFENAVCKIADIFLRPQCEEIKLRVQYVMSTHAHRQIKNTILTSPHVHVINTDFTQIILFGKKKRVQT